MNRVSLRALTKGDVGITKVWHNDESIMDFYLGHPFYVNIEMESAWYERILMSNIPTTVFGIELLETQELIGISILKDINLINRNAEFAIYIGNHQMRGKGIAQEATQQVLKFAFHRLGLHRIWLRVRIDNEQAIRLYEKAGFTKEGVLAQSLFKNGVFYDVLQMGLLIHDFNKNLSTSFLV